MLDPKMKIVEKLKEFQSTPLNLLSHFLKFHSISHLFVALAIILKGYIFAHTIYVKLASCFIFL
jgi:hypothetical protein